MPYCFGTKPPVTKSQIIIVLEGFLYRKFKVKASDRPMALFLGVSLVAAITYFTATEYVIKNAEICEMLITVWLRPEEYSNKESSANSRRITGPCIKDSKSQ